MRCIINCSSYPYTKNLKRQERKIRESTYTGEYLVYSHQWPPGALPHHIIPYHFKPMAFLDAYNRGFRQILWLDSPVYPARSMDPIFETIERDGYLIPLNGWSNGEWTCDAALKPLGMGRESSFSQPHAMACVLGFDLSREDVLRVFMKWKDSAPLAFPGPYKNDDCSCSSDVRVLGHKHDQSAISAFAYQAGWHFTPITDGKLLTYGNEEGYLLYSKPI